MKFNSRGGISIFELFVYFPALAVAAFVCSRHGFGRNSGWIYTLILCLIRIIGACCQLSTYSSHSKGLFEATIIMDSIGISPLLLATLGLLSRCADSINETSSSVFNAFQFRIVQIIIVVALILSIDGGTSSISSTGVYTAQTTSKIGVILYFVGFIALLVIAFTITTKLSRVSEAERKLVWAVDIALPIILVRMIYSALSVFKHNHNFNIITGSVAILVCMSVLEEMAVVVIYLFIGWKSEGLSAAKRGPITSRPWKGPLNGATTGRSTIGRSGRGGPIHTLVGLAVAAAEGHKKGDVEEGRR